MFLFFMNFFIYLHDSSWLRGRDSGRVSAALSSNLLRVQHVGRFPRDRSALPRARGGRRTSGQGIVSLRHDQVPVARNRLLRRGLHSLRWHDGYHRDGQSAYQPLQSVSRATRDLERALQEL